jgi:hypothetical protein
MDAGAKSIDELSADDLDQHPIWAFANDDQDDLLVRPVAESSVGDLTGMVVGTRLRLANGRYVRAMLGNIDLTDPRCTQHFLTVSVENDGQWFHLARYHDHDHAARGPEALAQFLGLPLNEVFPMVYDIQSCARGNPRSVAGTIPDVPAERLTRAELIALAVP